MTKISFDLNIKNIAALLSVGLVSGGLSLGSGMIVIGGQTNAPASEITRTVEVNTEAINRNSADIKAVQDVVRREMKEVQEQVAAVKEGQAAQNATLNATREDVAEVRALLNQILIKSRGQ